MGSFGLKTTSLKLSSSKENTPKLTDNSRSNLLSSSGSGGSSSLRNSSGNYSADLRNSGGSSQGLRSSKGSISVLSKVIGSDNMKIKKAEDQLRNYFTNDRKHFKIANPYALLLDVYKDVSKWDHEPETKEDVSWSVYLIENAVSKQKLKFF